MRRTRRDEARELSDALLRDREKALKGDGPAMKRGGARDAWPGVARRAQRRKDNPEDFKAARDAAAPPRPASRKLGLPRPPSSQYTSRPGSRETSRPASRETSRPTSAAASRVGTEDGSVAPERSASDWAAPNHLERDLPPSFILALGFGEYCRGDAVWSARARAARCESRRYGGRPEGSIGTRFGG